MKNNSNALISKLFATASTYIENATAQPEILKKLGLQGFGQKRLQEGSALKNYAMMMHSQKTERYGEKQTLAAQLKENEQQARETFMEHVGIVKFAFRKDPLTLSQFNVEKVSKRINEWPMQASYFYDKISAFVAPLTPYGLTAEALAQGQAMVEAVASIRNQRMLRKGEAEEATRLRDQSIKDLKAWMSEFRIMAKLALKDSPQLLESLGIVMKTQKV
ncbi:hypothetical protein [Catalinimonas niigatensis]|uniref:hypothetical protein n=1 Tax=Catalinimonas niigatensis TaxID=1397264 RepID=UPI002665BE4C|nr:hypothetical protein [Catalinimonas niigatensis]WPP50687.1 hypothetical protein PZB72_28910 [Catalinimonas niigatensis]